MATELDHVEMAKTLLAARVVLNYPGRDQTPSRNSGEIRPLRIMEVLLATWESVSALSKFSTPLQPAIECGHMKQ